MTDDKRSRNEIIKENSRLLRGTIAEGLANVATGSISEDDSQLTKFHGTYLQDDRDLRPDMGVRVVFLAEASEEIVEAGAAKILIPEEAVVRTDGKTGVFVVERDRVRFQAVDTGEKRAGQIHVMRGLEPGQRIVLQPPVDLETGSRVQVEGS